MVVGIGLAPADIAGANLPKMRVGPAERGLKNEAEPVETDRKGHIESAQDLRAYVGKGDLETGNGGHARQFMQTHPFCPSLGKQFIESIHRMIRNAGSGQTAAHPPFGGAKEFYSGVSGAPDPLPYACKAALACRGRDGGEHHVRLAMITPF